MDEHSEAKQTRDTSRPGWTLRASNVVSFGVLILVNALASLGVLGRTNAEISQQFSTPLTPAGWAFGIWGFIFSLQLVGVVYQAMPQGYGADGLKARIVNTIGYGWQAGWAFEALWQLFFQLQSPLGMWICLACLLAATGSFGYTLFRLYRLKDTHGSLSSILLYTAFFLPTSVNTAWLSVATSVGAMVIRSAYHATEHQVALAVTLAAAITAIGVAVVHKERDSAYGLTLVWALVAVYGAQRNPAIRIAAIVCISLNCVISIFSMLRRKSPASVTEMSSEIRQPLARQPSM